MAKKQQTIGAIYKVAAFLAFLMLGYLGLRGYKNSVDKLKTDGCIDEIGELVRNIQQAYLNEYDYESLNYKYAVMLKLIPKRMLRPDYNEAVNSYLGGVDMFYSSLQEEGDNKAFEISFQGLSSTACQSLMKMQWDDGQNISYIAVGGFHSPTPSGVLDEVLISTKQEDIKSPYIFRGSTINLISSDRIKNACGCIKNTCSVVWKFF